MFGWLRTHVGLANVRRRLDEVEQDVDFIRKLLEKARGRATGGIRKVESEPEPENRGLPAARTVGGPRSMRGF